MERTQNNLLTRAGVGGRVTVSAAMPTPKHGESDKYGRTTQNAARQPIWRVKHRPAMGRACPPSASRSVALCVLLGRDVTVRGAAQRKGRTMTHYRIRDWDKHFENNRTRDMVKMAWVPVPNKHDGEGFQRIMQEPDGIAIYGCWHLILQVASKVRDRGTLLRDDGTPITPDALAIKTGWRNPKQFERALAFCSLPEVGWIEVVTDGTEQIPQEGAGIPQAPARKGMEGNGIEGNGSKDPAVSGVTTPSAPKKRSYGEFEGVKLTDDEHAKLLAKHGKERLEQGIAILDDYMRSKGKRYKDHYAALKETSWVWERVDQQRAAAGLSVPVNRQPAVAVPAYILRERAERERAAAAQTAQNDPTIDPTDQTGTRTRQGAVNRL
jgi:hypothetical protein